MLRSALTDKHNLRLIRQCLVKAQGISQFVEFEFGELQILINRVDALITHIDNDDLDNQKVTA